MHAAGEPTAGLLGDDHPVVTDSSYMSPPDGVLHGVACIGFLHNCRCPKCFNESRETAHSKPVPNTEGVTEMDELGRRNLMKDRKKRKLSRTPSPVH